MDLPYKNVDSIFSKCHNNCKTNLFVDPYGDNMSVTVMLVRALFVFWSVFYIITQNKYRKKSHGYLFALDASLQGPDFFLIHAFN